MAERTIRWRPRDLRGRAAGGPSPEGREEGGTGVRAEKSITIHAPAQADFDYVSDLTRHPEWASQHMEVRREGSGPLAEGTKFAHTGKQMGAHQDEVTITELQPGSRITFESKGDAGHARHWFDVRGQKGTTVLTKGVEFVKASTSTRMATPLLVFLLPAAMNKDLKRIKAKVEG